MVPGSVGKSGGRRRVSGLVVRIVVESDGYVHILCLRDVVAARHQTESFHATKVKSSCLSDLKLFLSNTKNSSLSLELRLSKLIERCQ